MRSIICFASGSDICSAMLRASSPRAYQCAGLSRMESGTTLFIGKRWKRNDTGGADVGEVGIAAMPTPKECRQHAEECLRLAKETTQIYAKQALLELAAEFREIAEELERRSSYSAGAKRRRAHNNSAPP